MLDFATDGLRLYYLITERIKLVLLPFAGSQFVIVSDHGGNVSRGEDGLLLWTTDSLA